jgi:hypothetical protein
MVSRGKPKNKFSPPPREDLGIFDWREGIKGGLNLVHRLPMSVVARGGGIIIRCLHFIFFHPHLSPPPSRGRRIGRAFAPWGVLFAKSPPTWLAILSRRSLRRRRKSRRGVTTAVGGATLPGRLMDQSPPGVGRDALLPHRTVSGIFDKRVPSYMVSQGQFMIYPG